MPKTGIISEVSSTHIIYTINGSPRKSTLAEFNSRYWHVCPNPRPGAKFTIPDGGNITVTKRFFNY